MRRQIFIVSLSFTRNDNEPRQTPWPLTHRKSLVEYEQAKAMLSLVNPGWLFRSQKYRNRGMSFLDLVQEKYGINASGR